jgi:hypothetical protein
MNNLILYNHHALHNDYILFYILYFVLYILYYLIDIIFFSINLSIISTPSNQLGWGHDPW